MRPIALLAATAAMLACAPTAQAGSG
jgi:hypothetical protein